MNEKLGKALVVVVAKEPIPGKVKTRLCPELSPTDAAGLYKCFLLDRIREISTLPGVDRGIAYTPENALETFSAMAGDGFDLFPQRGEGLGERLNNIFLDKLGEGYDAVAIIDSDTPDLPSSLIKESFRLLLSKQTEVVFGPCHDGGYYLVGMREPHPALFSGIPWSTSNVLSMSLKKSRKLGLNVNLLSYWNDLDTFEDVLKFYRKYKDGWLSHNGVSIETLGFLSHLEKVNQCMSKGSTIVERGLCRNR
jgi:rSAM/selenodomain-associated transferase 1